MKYIVSFFLLIPLVVWLAAAEDPPSFNAGNATQCITTNSTTLTANMLIGTGGRGVVNGSASGAVPANADGSASTAAQVTALFPGFIETNKNVNAICIFTNNGVSIDVNSSGIFTLTNYAAAGLGFVWSTNGSGTNTGNIQSATLNTTGVASHAGFLTASAGATILNKGAAGTLSLNANAGSSPVLFYTGPWTNDSHFQVSYTTGSGSVVSGTHFTNIFSSAFSSIPSVIVMPRSLNGAKYLYFNAYAYVTNVTTTSFEMAWGATTPGTGQGPMIYEFIVLQ